jgi:GWxTD domain-containing protein
MTLAETPFTHALGLALFHFLWQGALIALALAVGLYIFQPSSARLRYGLACAAMLSMLVSFGLTLGLAWPHRAGTVSVRIQHAPRLSPLLPPSLPSGIESAPPATSRLQWIVSIWMLGVGLFALRSLMSWGAAQRLRRIGVCAAPDCWQQRVRLLADRIQLSRPVVLLESCLTEVPAVVGFLRPAILAPVGLLAGFAPEQFECILIHELAHIRRYDYLVNLLQSLAEDLLFYHPAVWWVSGLIRAERENCCDDVVVAAKGDARGLAAALAALEHYRGNTREAALAANGGHLMNRIRRLLEGRETRRATAAPVFFAGLLLASAALSMSTIQSQPAEPPKARPAPLPYIAKSHVVIPAAKVAAERHPQVLLAQAPSNQTPTPAARPQDSAYKKWLEDDVVWIITNEERKAFRQVQTDQARQELLKQLETPYTKWLEEDVAWIITNEERKAFQQLQTDDERQRFIEQFWLRRDPTPGTPQNEYKEEHYRRMAYADQRFPEKAIPGWKSDRGRIYIMFGPPDEIDSHSTGGTYQRPPEQGGGTISTFPFEKWTYRFIEGIGNNISLEFVDTAGTGEYHMTMDPAEKDRLLNVPGAALPAPQWFRRQQ